jgi:hypothetical protein
LRRVNIIVVGLIAVTDMLARIKLVAAMTGLAFYIVFNRGCYPEDQNRSTGLVQYAWAEIRGFFGLD